MMTAIELLTKDHRKVEDLFKQMESGKGEKRTIFSQVYKELTLHSEAEETFFYPELELSSETSGEVQHSYREHQEVKNLLEELASGNPNDTGWMSKFKELKQDVLHHVEEEEGELFPKAKEVLGENKLAEIGQKIEALKKSKGPEFRAA